MFQTDVLTPVLFDQECLEICPAALVTGEGGWVKLVGVQESHGVLDQLKVVQFLRGGLMFHHGNEELDGKTLVGDGKLKGRSPIYRTGRVWSLTKFYSVDLQSRVCEGYEGEKERNGREKHFPNDGSLICPPGKSKIFSKEDT